MGDMGSAIKIIDPIGSSMFGTMGTMMGGGGSSSGSSDLGGVQALAGLSTADKTRRAQEENVDEQKRRQRRSMDLGMIETGGNTLPKISEG